MKKLLLAALTVLAGRLAPAQTLTPTWQAALATSQAPGTSSAVQAVVADASGNVYLAGTFRGTATFGATTLSSAGGSDAFVAKWNAATGSFAWALRAGSTADDASADLAVSGSSLYLVGTFSGASISLGNYTLTNGAASGATPTPDVFVAKLSDVGVSAGVVWALRAGGAAADGVSAVAVSGSSVYVVGYYDSVTADFGNFTLSNSGLGSSSDVYIAKLTDAGNSASFGWVQSDIGDVFSDEQATDVAVVGSTVYVAGRFSVSTRFGTVVVTTAGGTDVFVTKLTDAGSSSTYNWVQRAGGTGDDAAASLALGPAALYVVGTFASATATFGTTTLTQASPTASDLFVARVNDSGTTAAFAWALGVGGTGFEAATAVVAAGSSVYLAGRFNSPSLSFGAASLLNAAGTNGTTDILVGRVVDAGSSATMGWAQRAGGLDADGATALSLAGTTLYVGGSAIPAASFGSQAIAGPVGAEVGYLASLGGAALPTRASADELAGAAVFPNPARGAATVRVPAGSGLATVQVLDARGCLVRRAAVPAGADYALALAGLAPGLYAVRVAVGEALTTTRLAVE